MFTRRDGRIIGILNDWDLAAYTKSRGKATSTHRTGTAAYMATDLLNSANSDKPLAHEYQHDLESFLWILIWCAFVLRFNGRQIEWAKQYTKIKEWTDTTPWPTIANSKRVFLNAYSLHLPFVTPEMQSLKATWIAEVCYFMWLTFLARAKPPLPERLKNRRDVETEYDFFTFENVMGVLDPEMTDPKEDVLKYGKSL